jgi:hypothetical protein
MADSHGGCSIQFSGILFCGNVPWKFNFVQGFVTKGIKDALQRVPLNQVTQNWIKEGSMNHCIVGTISDRTVTQWTQWTVNVFFTPWHDWPSSCDAVAVFLNILHVEVLCPTTHHVMWAYYNRHTSFAGLSIAVLLIRGKIVVIFVHRGVGPSLFRGHPCAGARSNTQQPASARLSQ